jgi:hypothetical protein
MIQSKTCTKCGEDKYINEYTKRSKSVDGLQHQCKKCTRLRLAAYRKDKPDVYTSTSRKCNLKKYGLTPESFTDLAERQSYSCAICFKPLDLSRTGKGKFAVDHNHATGAVRGILCAPCNLGIGKLADSPTILRSAAHYLEINGYYG